MRSDEEIAQDLLPRLLSMRVRAPGNLIASGARAGKIEALRWVDDLMGKEASIPAVVFAINAKLRELEAKDVD
jgi:hypothetical protein